MSNSPFAELFKHKAERIDRALASLFTEPESDGLVRLNESMRYSVQAGGKRLRPILLTEFAALGGLKPERSLNFACAMDLVHTYSLIHDDLPCMDDDDTRRGKPANHIVFGYAGAVLAGDALLNAAYELMLASIDGVSAEARLAAASEIASGAGRLGMVAGQCLDIANENGCGSFDLDRLIKLSLLKTGGIIRASCRAGLRLAGVTDAKLLSAADRYGSALGIAFQMRDDLLDVCGSSAALGKPTGSDARTGKQTFAALLGKDETSRAIAEYTAKAVDALACFDNAEFLRELAQSLAVREY